MHYLHIAIFKLERMNHTSLRFLILLKLRINAIFPVGRFALSLALAGNVRKNFILQGWVNIICNSIAQILKSIVLPIQ